MQTKNLKQFVCLAVATAFGIGLSPLAPGSLAALWGVAVHLACIALVPAKYQLACLVAAFVVVCLAHILLTPWAEAYWDVKDPGHFVLDEIAGYLVIPILFPHGALWKVVLWGFCLFRILDIFKLIPPTKYIDRNIHGAWGILLDDIVSAGYATLIMYLLFWFGPHGIIH